MKNLYSSNLIVHIEKINEVFHIEKSTLKGMIETKQFSFNKLLDSTFLYHLSNEIIKLDLFLQKSIIKIDSFNEKNFEMFFKIKNIIDFLNNNFDLFFEEIKVNKYKSFLIEKLEQINFDINSFNNKLNMKIDILSEQNNKKNIQNIQLLKNFKLISINQNEIDILWENLLQKNGTQLYKAPIHIRNNIDIIKSAILNSPVAINYANVQNQELIDLAKQVSNDIGKTIVIPLNKRKLKEFQKIDEQNKMTKDEIKRLSKSFENENSLYI